MVMDWLHSCYATTMRLHQGSDVETPVVWYWAAPGAKWFDGPTLFGSHNWTEKKGEYNPLGEVVGAKRPYRKGVAPGRYQGQHFCGKVEWFRSGFPRGPLPPSPICDQDGVPQCCQRFPGGIAWKGSGLPGKKGYVGEIEAGSVSGFAVRSGEIEAQGLSGFAVRSGEIEAGSVTSPGLFVSSGEIEAGSVTSPGLFVSSGEIEAGSVSGFAVRSGEIEAGSVSGFAVRSGEIEAGSVPQLVVSAGEIEAGGDRPISTASVRSGEIEAGSVPQLTVSAGEIEAGSVPPLVGELRTGEIEAGAVISPGLFVSSGEIEGATVARDFGYGAEIEAGGLIDPYIWVGPSPVPIPRRLILSVDGRLGCGSLTGNYAMEYDPITGHWVAIPNPAQLLLSATYYPAGPGPFDGWDATEFYPLFGHGIGFSGTLRLIPFGNLFLGFGSYAPQCSGNTNLYWRDAQECAGEKEGCYVPGPSPTISLTGEVETLNITTEWDFVVTGEVDGTRVDAASGTGELESANMSIDPSGLTETGEIEAASADGVFSVCSPAIMPTVLYADITDVASCSVVAGTYTLNYTSSPYPQWFTTFTAGGISCRIEMVCGSIGPTVGWVCTFFVPGFSWAQLGTVLSLYPFNDDFGAFPNFATLCAGTFAIRIYE